MWYPATLSIDKFLLNFNITFGTSVFACCCRFQHDSLCMLIDQAVKFYDNSPTKWNIVHCTRKCLIMITWVLNPFGYIWCIETTWLDLPVSVQKCAFTGLCSAFFMVCLPLFPNCDFWGSHLSPLLGTVLYNVINYIYLPSSFLFFYSRKTYINVNSGQYSVL